MRLPRARPAAAQRLLADRDLDERSADQQRAQIAHDRFDFGQFGHDGSSARDGLLQ